MTAELLKSQAKTNKVLVDFINQQQTEKRLEQEAKSAEAYQNAVLLLKGNNMKVGGKFNVDF